MRTLSPSLLAAQKSGSAVPYLKAVVSDRIGGVRRLAFSRLYTGSEPDGYHAAAMPGDGSLLRARVAAARLYYQRTVNPGAGSDYSAWTDLSGAAGAGVALCAEGSRALLFYVDPGGVTIKVRESTDNGATLGAPVTVATASGAVAWLAADVKANGDALALYSVGATVFSVKRSGGAWGAPAAWSNNAASLTGLACFHQGDYNTLVTGTDAAGNAFAWSCLFGDGFSQAPNTWSPLREISVAHPGSGVSYHTPFLGQPDTYRASFVEKYTGGQSYSRPHLSYSPAAADFVANLWREPVPFDFASGFGLAIAYSAGSVWLSAPAGVWTATLNAPSLDVTADVLEAATAERPFEGRLRLVLRNDDGRYSAPPAAIKLGGEVRLSPGYVTAAGPGVSDGPAYWIQALERTSRPGEAALVIEARDGWSLLEGWRARRQYVWSAGQTNVFGILQYLFARAGLEFASAGSSAAAGNLYPAYTVGPGDSGLAAARRLLDKLPDVVFFRGEFGFLKEPLSGEATAYAYGAGHALLSGRYADLLPGANRAQAFGRGAFAERFDWAGVASVYDRLEQALDANLTTVQQADERAGFLLRHGAMGAQSGEVAAPVNCGQELYDVVEVTDGPAGLSAARRRVLGLSLRYSTGDQPAYVQRLGLGGV